MVVVRATSASPALGTDLMEIAALKPYTKGRTWRKVAWIAFSGDTLGQGDLDLKYGADTIFKGIECTTATIDAYDYTHDIQPVVDKRWCSPQSEIRVLCTVSLIVTTAPGVTVGVMLGIVERMSEGRGGA